MFGSKLTTEVYDECFIRANMQRLQVTGYGPQDLTATSQHHPVVCSLWSVAFLSTMRQFVWVIEHESVSAAYCRLQPLTAPQSLIRHRHPGAIRPPTPIPHVDHRQE